MCLQESGISQKPSRDLMVTGSSQKNTGISKKDATEHIIEKTTYKIQLGRSWKAMVLISPILEITKTRYQTVEALLSPQSCISQDTL